MIANLTKDSFSSHLSVRFGAIFFVVAPLQFFAGMILAALFYGPPPYNLQYDSISDLQAVRCGMFQGSYVCSPLHLIANFSVVVLGFLLVTGTILIRTAFPVGRRKTLAIALLIAAGLSAIANGFTPEDVTLVGDIVTALLAFLGANLGLIQIGRLMSHDPKWSALGTPTQILGAIGLGALILDGLNIAGLGSGLLEWIIVAPILVWTFVLGFRLSIFRPSSPMEVFRK